MTTTEITDSLHEALNGLCIGWQMANVRDDAQRAHLQAPIIAGQEAILSLLAHFENQKAAA